MIIGTDASLDTCKNEGYLMIKFDARKKFDINTCYDIFSYYPDYIIKESNGQITKNEKLTDTCASFADLTETYNRYKKELDDFAETNEAVNFEDPTIYDLLNLASDISSYCGLD